MVFPILSNAFIARRPTPLNTTTGNQSLGKLDCSTARANPAQRVAVLTGYYHACTMVCIPKSPFPLYRYLGTGV